MSHRALPWVNPVGGLGDCLMLSSVLKLALDADPARRFNLVRRTKYPPLLQGHPAIERIGHPPPGATILSADYWHHERFGAPGQRAFQILARMFGLVPPVPETLYVPWSLELDDPILEQQLPWQERNVLLCPTSESPRKQPDPQRFEAVVRRLRDQGLGVVQVGARRDPHIRGAYSLLGLTTTRQVVRLMRRFDVVLTCDSFLMHAARLCAVPAVVLWGPTDHQLYGYDDQLHLQAEHCGEECIAPGNSVVYEFDCPRLPDHCMDQLQVDAITDAVLAQLNGRSPADPG